MQLRDDKLDRQVWADTFTGLYHVPPPECDPKTVLDLGCNIGLTTAHYCSMWPLAKVVGVEMDHDCVRMARLNAPDATILEHAVGGANGKASYDDSVRSDSYSVGGEGVEVEVFDLTSTIISAFPEEGRVDFVKMDIEGSEWDVFADGSWAPMVSAILVELHDSGTSPEIVAKGIAELERIGFHASHHTRHPQAVWAHR